VKTYGTLHWASDPLGIAYFGLQVVPHVAIKAKRLFPRVEQERAGLIKMLDTPEVAADLTWFTNRYPLEMTTAVRDRLELRAGEHRDYMASIEDLLAGRRTLDEFPPPARPAREYQQIAADLAYLTGGLLLGDEVGLGKTQSALMLLRDPTTLPALLVVPTHLPKQWLRELNTVLPHLRGHIITKSTPVVRTATGTKPYDTADADVLVMSYSKLAGWRDVLTGRIKTIIFDEVQELRHDGTYKYGAAAAIADAADRRMGLSATPIYNYGGEAYAIFEVLKPGVLGTRAEFFREWGGSVRSTGQVVVRDPGALGEYLRDQGLLLRRTRADVGRELPAPTEVVMEIPSDTDATDRVQGDIIALAEKVLHGDKTERFTASGQIDMLLRKATGVDKAPHVAEFARFLLESEAKIVLFGWHRDVYSIWLRRLADFDPVMYTGSESPAQKDAAVRRFTDDPDCRIFICSLRSGAGLNGLQDVASVAVFGELDWSPAMHHQAIGRLARDGQEGQVVAYYLVSEVGSDPVISGVLEDKRQQAEPFMAGDDGRLFTATNDAGDRAKQLAKAILAHHAKEPVR
jgi:SNF2 family DNA or RNA helicase